MTLHRVLALIALMLPLPALADPAAALRAALAAAPDWTRATALAAASTAAGADVITWQRLRAGEGTLTEYEDFLARRPDWPGLPLLHEKGEVAVARSITPSRVIRYFAEWEPETGTGSLALVRAWQATGNSDAAAAEARRAFLNLPLTAEEEQALLALYPSLARLAEQRLAHLLWSGEAAEARRLLPRVSEGWAALARARLALMDRAAGVTALVAAVPGELARHPLLAQARTDWRIARDLWPDAAELMVDHSTSAEALGRPEAWAKRRAQLARYLLRRGEAAQAYRVAARHQLTEGSDYADLEFVAGFVALRKLGDAQTALRHFRHLEQAVGTPISLSRALYWQGRALEVLGDPAATDAYRAAARHQTAYYGQLAAERLGQPLDAALLAPLAARDWRQAGFARSSVLEAGLLLLKAGDRTLAKRFVLHLSEDLGAEDRASLAALMLTVGEPHIAVLLGKQAAERGIILPEAYFPLPAMVPEQGLGVSRALALAIARRESEFDPAARSSAGARGLMQLMPETAERMARDLGLPFALSRLTSDPGYNAQLGTAYLAKLVDEFGPSIALVASGYNAGPGRPRRWIDEFGDPRAPDVDVIDWIETIPFEETRVYVMRVAESLVIYRARLRGSPGPITLTAELKGD